MSAPARTTLRRTASVLLAVGVLVAVPLQPAPAARAATPAPPASGRAPAWVRATHLVPGLPRMDIDLRPVVDGAPGAVAGTVAGAAYGDVSTYRKLPAGAYAVSVRPAGSAPDAAPVVTGTLQARTGHAYTLAALGTAAAATILPLDDDLAPPPAGQSRVRVLSAAAAAPSVDVTAVDGPVVTRAAAFGTATGYADVPAGRWTLTVDPSAGVAAAATPGRTDVELAAGSTYTLAVTDARGPLTVTPVADASGSATAPVGGAATGAGGTAVAHPSTALPGAVTGAATGAAAAGTGAAVLLALRRRRQLLPR